MSEETLNIIQDLEERMSQRSNGVVAILAQSGIITDTPTTKDLYDASLIDEKAIEKVVILCY